MFGAPGICSKSSSEHLLGSFEHLPESFEHLIASFEHLIASSEHLDTLREIARRVGSVRKAPKKAVYRSREAQTHICEGCYSRLVREGNARVGVR